METNKISLLRKKFQALKAIIKNWSRDEMLKASAVRHSAQSRISELDKLIDKGLSNNDIINERISLLKDIHDLDKRHSSDLAQKAKIQWAIEGDENSKYFHGIINKKRSQLAIRGVLVDGEWIEDPPKVKNEFLEHFSNRFSMPTGQTINLDSHMFQKISIDQNADLESDVSLEEIQHDVVNAVKKFFSSSKFPPESNSSFITLIPKSLDAKMVKDFRPISLIGSFYKIVAKILSNRLCIVMPDLISDVQTAFISKHGGFKRVFLRQWDRFWLMEVPHLSPFFFFVMESLHISFNNILNSGLYKGIRIDESLTLSHLFYADDAVFIGKWDKANVITIVNMLKCFYLVSGLKINIQKSKIMGIDCNKNSTVAEKINASSISCSFRRLPRGSLKEEQFSKLIEDVNSVILSISNDRWIWSLDSSGEFSIKSTRIFIDDHFLLAVGAPTRWVSEVPIKINIMAWKVSLDKLPTRLNLSLRGIEIPSITCPICSCAGESCSHLFFLLFYDPEHYYQTGSMVGV
ncbi:RNA-directed DNA polymerase, eukaryota [Tanacetum coccineum]